VRVLAAGKDGTTTQLRGVMTREPHTMPPGRTAIEALRLMHDGGFRHVPVVEDEILVALCRMATSAAWSTTGWMSRRGFGSGLLRLGAPHHLSRRAGEVGKRSVAG
jgi:CBS domain-containing protein